MCARYKTKARLSAGKRRGGVTPAAAAAVLHTSHYNSITVPATGLFVYGRPSRARRGCKKKKTGTTKLQKKNTPYKITKIWLFYYTVLGVVCTFSVFLVPLYQHRQTYITCVLS